jgi:dihydroorotase
LPYNEGTITLTKESWDVPATYPFGSEELVPLRAGERMPWRVAR